MGAPDFILDNGTGRELVPSISIAGLLAQRDAMLARILAGCEALWAAEEISQASGLEEAVNYRGFEWMLLGPDRYHRETNILKRDCLANIRKRADACAWDLLMKKSGLMTLMDATARKEWRERIDKCETPELTRENIASTFAGLYDSRGDIFERGVIACFRKLNWDYKTNQPFKFGKRIILRIRSYGHFAHERVDDLVDLQRVFCVVDGKPEEDHRAGLYHRLGARHDQSRGVHDDTYMHIRWFKNGNGHITFKRLDLVERLNRIIAKHFPGALPAPQEEQQ